MYNPGVNKKNNGGTTNKRLMCTHCGFVGHTYISVTKNIGVLWVIKLGQEVHLMLIKQLLWWLILV